MAVRRRRRNWTATSVLLCATLSLSVLLSIDYIPYNEAAPLVGVEPAAGPPEVPGSYRTAKRLLYDEVFDDHRQTLYCGCSFDGGREPDHASCGYQPLDGGERAHRVEAEHVIPASWIGGRRQCWREPICTDGDGERFSGRRCCEQVDAGYRRAANDLHNLWPTVGEVNAQRSNYRFGLIEGEVRTFGRCDVEVDHAARLIEPRSGIRGDIARIGLYMEAVHGVWLSDAHRVLFDAWNRADPPDAFERERNARIRALQGRGNPFIEDYDRRLARGPADPG